MMLCRSSAWEPSVISTVLNLWLGSTLTENQVHIGAGLGLCLSAVLCNQV